ncbi:hypothetical protein HDV00_010721, partial [Rhizophlyctis rosea]
MNFHIAEPEVFESLIPLTPFDILSKIIEGMTTSLSSFPHNLKLMALTDPVPPGPEEMADHLQESAERAGALGRSSIVMYILKNPLAESNVKAETFLGCLMGGYATLVQECEGRGWYTFGDVDLGWSRTEIIRILERGPDNGYQYLIGQPRLREWMRKDPRWLDGILNDANPFGDVFDDEANFVSIMNHKLKTAIKKDLPKLSHFFLSTILKLEEEMDKNGDGRQWNGKEAMHRDEDSSTDTGEDDNSTIDKAVAAIVKHRATRVLSEVWDKVVVGLDDDEPAGEFFKMCLTSGWRKEKGSGNEKKDRAFLELLVKLGADLKNVVEWETTYYIWDVNAASLGVILDLLEASHLLTKIPCSDVKPFSVDFDPADTSANDFHLNYLHTLSLLIINYEARVPRNHYHNFFTRYPSTLIVDGAHEEDTNAAIFCPYEKNKPSRGPLHWYAELDSNLLRRPVELEVEAGVEFSRKELKEVGQTDMWSFGEEVKEILEDMGYDWAEG